MSKKQQMVAHALLLMIGLSGFILQVFVWEAPDGTFGLVLCLSEVALIIGSVIRLCQLSKTVQHAFLDLLDALFCIR